MRSAAISRTHHVRDRVELTQVKLELVVEGHEVEPAIEAIRSAAAPWGQERSVVPLQQHDRSGYS